MDIASLVIKILTLIILALYIVFTFVVFNQVVVMNRLISLRHASVFVKIIAIFNIILAISLFLLTVVIL